MCKWGADIEIRVRRPGPSGRTVIKVDSCIASLIQILNDYGIETLASCCGHGKVSHAHIRLASENVLLTRFGDSYSVHLRFPYPIKEESTNG